MEPLFDTALPAARGAARSLSFGAWRYNNNACAIAAARHLDPLLPLTLLSPLAAAVRALAYNGVLLLQVNVWRHVNIAL